MTNDSNPKADITSILRQQNRNNPNLGLSKISELNKKLFANLPPIPEIEGEEKQANIMLESAFNNELHKMIGSWLMVDDFRAGREISDQASELYDKLSTGEKTSITTADGWHLGFPIVQRLYQQCKNGSKNYNRDLGDFFTKFNYGDTWTESYDDFVALITETLTNTTNEDLEIAKKYAHQPLSIDECEFLKRLKIQVLKDKAFSQDEKLQVSELIGKMAAHDLPYFLTLALQEIIPKLVDNKSLNTAEKKSFAEAIDLICAPSRLTPTEMDAWDNRPNIQAFWHLVTQTGFKRFGDLQAASCDLQGYVDTEHNPIKGGLGYLKDVSSGLDNRQRDCNYVALAEDHQHAINLIENGLAHLIEVKKVFCEQPLAVVVPVPDSLLIKDAVAKYTQITDSTRRAVYNAQKAYDRNIKKLTQSNGDEDFDRLPLGSKSKNLLNKLQTLETRIKYRVQMFEQLFEPVMQRLSATVESGEHYSSMSNDHKDLILALQSFRTSFVRDVEKTEREFLPLLITEIEKNQSNKHYAAIVTEIKNAGEKILTQQKEVIAALATLHGNLTQNMDAVACATFTAERMVDYVEIMLKHMRVRQPILNQYADAEKRASYLANQQLDGYQKS